MAYLTDVGLMDPYAGSIKGVTLRFCIDARIVDITHGVRSFDIAGASFTLLLTYKYFPHGTVFAVVVVPGVGASERPILIVSRNYFFVGPDNGVLLPAAEDDSIEYVLSLSNTPYFRDKATRTFHGRDIFAPIAAMLVCGTPPETLGEPVSVSSLVRLSYGDERAQYGDDLKSVRLTVRHVDKYGNLMLTGDFKEIAKALDLTIGCNVIVCSRNVSVEAVVAKSFASIDKGTLIFYKNSYGLAELAVNQGVG